MKLQKIVNKLSKNYTKHIFVCLFLFLLAFLVRWYKLSDNLFFGFEQGRDAMVVQDILSLRHFPLIGPSTSTPGIFHGSLYYYLLAIPYGLGSGNPLFASFVLSFIGALTSVVAFTFAKNIFNSFKWGIVYSLLVAFSYEYILYSRWLSNVSPAIPLILTAYFCLWCYSKLNQGKYLILFLFFAALSSLFEMILIPQYAFVFLLLWVFRIIKIPSKKDLVIGFIVSFMVFSPLMLFDFRNDHISSKSLVSLINGSGSKVSFYDSSSIFLLQSSALLQNSLINVKESFIKLIFSIFLLIGFLLYLRDKNNFRNGTFLLIWSLMGLPLIILGPGNTHNYVGIGLAWILVFCCSLKGFWNSRFRIFTILLILFLSIGWKNGLNDLSSNKNVFFVTIQDDLNYADQKRVLDYIHQDALGKPYRLVAFTIPYLHPEGWNYLHNFYYPLDSPKGSSLIYLVIEKNVASVWSDKWIKELGSTRLVDTRQFGLLEVQKRLIKEK